MKKLEESEKQEVRDLVCDLLVCDPEYLTDDTILEDLGCDSIDLVELFMEVEKKFNCQIPDDEIEPGLSISAFFTVIENYI